MKQDGHLAKWKFKFGEIKIIDENQLIYIVEVGYIKGYRENEIYFRLWDSDENFIMGNGYDAASVDAWSPTLSKQIDEFIKRLEGLKIFL